MASRKKLPPVPRFLALDTETTGTNFHSNPNVPWVFAVSLCNHVGVTNLFVWPVNPRTRKVEVNRLDLIKIKSLIDKYDHIVMHNARFDKRAMATLGIDIPFHKIHDTLIASHVLDNTEDHSLKALALKYLGIPTDDQKELQVATVKARSYGKKAGWNLAAEVAHDSWMPAAVDPTDKRLRKYALLDAERTAALWAAVYWPMLHQQKLWDQYIDHLRVFPAIYDMESCGISLRKRTWDKEHKRYQKAAAAKDRIAQSLVPKDFNINSGKQLQEQLYGRWKLPIIARTKQGISTSAPTLRSLLDCCRDASQPNRFLTAILEGKRNRTAAGHLESFHEIAIVRGEVPYLHPSVNQTGTRTTRVSAFPQNVGKGADLQELGFSDESEIDFKLRMVFGPAKDRVWYSYDYDQLQLRIFAHVSGEDSMVKAFADGWDAHSYVASEIFKTDKPNKLQRRVAKNVNFGFIFGAQPAKIEATAGIPGLWDTVVRIFPNAHKFMDATKKLVKKQGYVHTMGGYRLFLPPVRDRFTGRMAPKHYAGVCYIVQGTEGEIVKDAMVRVNGQLSGMPNHNLIMQVHDELVFDMPAKEPKALRDNTLRILQNEMNQAGKRYGVVTKVNCELIKTSWDNGKLLLL